MSDAIRAGGSACAPSIHDNLDMTGVDPLRFAEVRRRVGAIREYLSLHEPTDDERATHAATLGLSVNQFMALVRAWREYGRASAISGAGAQKGTPRPTGASTLPPASKSVAMKVIASVDPGTSLVEIVRLTKERCESLGLKCPSRNTIWNLLRAFRSRHGTTGGTGLIVSRCHLKMPVHMDAGVTFPPIVLGVDMGTGEIVEAGLGPHHDIMVAMAAAMRAREFTESILIDSELGPLPDYTTTSVSPTKARSMTAAVLGRGFGSIDLIYRRSKAIAPAAALRSGKDAPVDLADARRIVADEVARHNKARGVRTPNPTLSVGNRR